MVESVYDELARLLREMAGRYGNTVFSDRRRLVSLLSDRLPDARPQIKVVSSAADERVFESLLHARPEQLAMEIERLAANLETGYGIRLDIAVPVVRACAYGLSLGGLPSETAHVVVPRPVPQADSNDSWVGLSQTTAGSAPPAIPPPATPVVFFEWAKTFTNKWPKNKIVWIILVVLVGPYVLIKLALDNNVPAPAPHEQPQPQTPVTSPPEGQPQTPAPGGTQPTLYGDERHDYGIPPQTSLQSNVGSPTPLTVPGGQTITTMGLYTSIQKGLPMVLIDALNNAHQETLAGAVPLPNAGQYGSFDDPIESVLTADLNRLTNGDRNLPVVFFCQGPECWESYNAVLRAQFAGYTNLYWYRGGLTAWREAGFSMQPLN